MRLCPDRIRDFSFVFRTEPQPSEPYLHRVDLTTSINLINPEARLFGDSTLLSGLQSVLTFTSSRAPPPTREGVSKGNKASPAELRGRQAQFRVTLEEARRDRRKTSER